MNPAGFWRLAHVLGFALWLGLAATLAFTTARAARSGDRAVAAFAYRSAARLMKTLGLPAMVLTLAGGIGLTVALGYPFFRPFPDHWLFQMQVLGILAFALGAFYQVPLADRLARAAEASAAAGEDSDAYRRYRARNAIVGSVVGAILLLVIALATLRP